MPFLKNTRKYTTGQSHSLKQSISLIPIPTHIFLKGSAVAFSAHLLAAEAGFKKTQVSVRTSQHLSQQG